MEHKAETKKKALSCKVAGQTFEDPILAEWPEIIILFMIIAMFCGDLGNEVNDDVLSEAFSRFSSFNMAREKRTGKMKGCGFGTFSNPSNLAGAIMEMNGKYVGNWPIKLCESIWRERTDHEALERQKNQSHKKPKLPKKSVLLRKQA